MLCKIWGGGGGGGKRKGKEGGDSGGGGGGVGQIRCIMGGVQLANSLSPYLFD